MHYIFKKYGYAGLQSAGRALAPNKPQATYVDRFARLLCREWLLPQLVLAFARDPGSDSIRAVSSESPTAHLREAPGHEPQAHQAFFHLADILLPAATSSLRASHSCGTIFNFLIVVELPSMAR